MKNFVFLVIIIPFLTLAQHTIKGTFSPAESFTFAILYQSTPEGVSYINQAKTNNDGTFSISLDSQAEAGIYKLVYAIPPESNNFDVFYNGKENITLHFDLEKGLTFTESTDNMLWETYTDSISKFNGQISAFYSSENSNKKDIKKIFKTLEKTQIQYEETATGTMVLPFIKSNRTYIPEDYEDITTYSSNLKKYYFDYFEFNNKWVQSSDFLTERVQAYVFAMPENVAAYQQAIDDVVNAVGDNDHVKIILLETLWQQMLNNEQPEVANYISDTYLLLLAQTNNRKDLEEALRNYSKTSIGKKAMDFDFTYLDENKPIKTSLYSFTQKTLLIFWSSSCSHCLEELPKVKLLMEKYPDMTVIAYGLEDGVKNWKKTIVDFPEFIHTYDLEKWEGQVVKDYGVESTPSYFILDTDKTILAKPDTVEALQTYLEK